MVRKADRMQKSRKESPTRFHRRPEVRVRPHQRRA